MGSNLVAYHFFKMEFISNVNSKKVLKRLLSQVFEGYSKKKLFVYVACSSSYFICNSFCTHCTQQVKHVCTQSYITFHVPWLLSHGYEMGIKFASFK